MSSILNQLQDYLYDLLKPKISILSQVSVSSYEIKGGKSILNNYNFNCPSNKTLILKMTIK